MDVRALLRIAGCHAKLARRDRVARVFFVFTLLLTFVAEFLHAELPFPGENVMLQLSSFIPYTSAYITCLFLFFPVILLAGWLARGRRVDSNDALDYRPASNEERAWGMAAGVGRVLATRAAWVMAVGALVHATLGRAAPFDGWVYLFYFATLIAPWLAFAIGASFAVTALARHRGLALLLLLGGAWAVFFVAGDAAGGAFDPTGLALPNAFSEITGHPDTGRYLLQRGGWLLVGLGLVQVAAAGYRRLPNNPVTRARLLPAMALLAAGMAMVGARYASWQGDRVARRGLAANYEAYRQAPKMTLVEQSLDFRQEGGRMALSSRMVLENRTGATVEEVILYLNPGLRVTSLRDERGEVGRERDRQVVRAMTRVGDGERRVLELECEGRIDERVCLLDLPERLYRESSGGSAFNCGFGRRHAILSDNYTWLTPECLWYPVAKAPADPVSPYGMSRDFSRYTLRVARGDGRTVISQGAREEEADGIAFRPEQPLRGISLCIGDYERRSMTVDSTLLELYLFKGHGKLLEGLEDVEDALPGVFEQAKDEAEYAAGKRYPFRRFALVERPLPLADDYREWHGGSEFVQPEMVFFPERGARVLPDPGRSIGLANMDRRARAEQVISRAIATLLNNKSEKFIGSVDLFSSIASFSPLERAGQSPGINPHEASSLFYDQVNTMYSPDFPPAGAAFHLLLGQRRPALEFVFAKSVQRAQLPVRVNDYLDGHSLRDAVEDRTLDPLALGAILGQKAKEMSQLFTGRGVSSDTVLAFVQHYLETHPFQEIPFERFNRDFSARFGADWMEALPAWYTRDSLPRFLVKPPAIWSDDEKAWLTFAVFNDSSAEGIVTLGRTTQVKSVTVTASGSVRVSEGLENVTTDYVIPPRTGKKVTFEMDRPPAVVIMDMNLAGNDPATFTRSVRVEFADRSPGEQPVDRDYFFTPGEIIVDNRDPGFSIARPSSDGSLRKRIRSWLRPDGERFGERFPSAERWSIIRNEFAHGLFIRDRVEKLAGNGKHAVRWSARLEEEGLYEVSAYVSKQVLVIYAADGASQKDVFQHYTITTAGGVEEVSVNVSRNEGWCALGRFRLAPGEHSVTLDDRGETQQSIAGDAIKWTRVE
ncbi:MAG: hypothetical protein LBG30_03090 [Odoribacteraceae bacterium]|jgi:hypothetical protein|nr:hypothetical protein [Odoribacteraceae bacterium]